MPPKVTYEIRPYGQRGLCQVCHWQNRKGPYPHQYACLNPKAAWDEDVCTTLQLVDEFRLAQRLGELYALLDAVWDVVTALLDRGEALPPAVLPRPPLMFEALELLDQADDLLGRCLEHVGQDAELSQAILRWTQRAAELPETEEAQP